LSEPGFGGFLGLIGFVFLSELELNELLEFMGFTSGKSLLKSITDTGLPWSRFTIDHSAINTILLMEL
jgi:hypothetical protein